MEGKPGKGRDGQWKRGGGAFGNDTGAAGDRRGRGRVGHHRGRGKRDHYRGRGRAFPEDGGADFFRRNADKHDDKEKAEDEMPTDFSRRKLESNWARYEESEKDDDVPVQRGTDYQVLLTSAGDSFTQFRFSEEKDWEVDSLGINQVPALFVDLEVLAHSLQELPLHARLGLEPNLVQELTPVELPSVSVHPLLIGFKPPDQTRPKNRSSLHALCPDQLVSGHTISSNNLTALISSVDYAEKELDLLLGIQKPVKSLFVSEKKTSDSVEEVSVNPEKAASPVQEMMEQKETEQKTNTNQLKPEDLYQKSKPEMTEEDLENWLDSMIS